MPFSRHAPSRRDIMKTGAAAALASTLAPIKPAGAADDGSPREAPALSPGKSAASGGKSRPFTTRPEIDGTFGVVAKIFSHPFALSLTIRASALRKSMEI